MAKKTYTLVGIDGNAYSVMGYVQSMMKECGYSKKEIDAYLADATSSDYDHLLAVSIDMVCKCNDKDEQTARQEQAELAELFDTVTFD